MCAHRGGRGKAAIAAGRMLVMSPFVVRDARTTKSLWTPDDPAIAPLVALGARFLPVADVPDRLGLQGTRP